MFVRLQKYGFDPYELTLGQMFEFAEAIQEEENESMQRAMTVSRCAHMEKNDYIQLFEAYSPYKKQTQDENGFEVIDFSDYEDEA